MSPSPHARQVLREFNYQCEREKRRERVKRFASDWAWLPISIAAVFVLWLVK